MFHEGPGQVALLEAIATQVKSLSGDMVLHIAGLSAPGIVPWEVGRDECGSPQARHRDLVPWSELSDEGELSRARIARLFRGLGPSRLLLACADASSPTVRLARELVREATGGADAFTRRDELEELLGRVLAAEPITQWYELIVLHQSTSGRLAFTSVPLFPPGARRGDRKSFSVRCEPGEEYGTVFAVVALESPGRARLLSVQTGTLSAGTYDLTAELRRPGLVRFDGLPAKLRPEQRPWTALVASVPAQLDPLRRSHLICAVEISGADAQVRDRLDRVDQLIKTAARGTEQRLAVSLVTYGPHPVHWNAAEEPVRVLTWAQSGAEALEQLWRLEGHPAETGYPRAARLECVLTEVAGRLTGQEGRPVLVTVGSRPAFPPRVDPLTEIIPCPDRNDWRRALHQLMDHPGIAFGAISDRDPDGGIWTSLGTDAFAPLSAFDARRFAARLGLLSANIPFPLVESGLGGAADSRAAPRTRAEKGSTTRLVEELVGIGGSDPSLLGQELDRSGQGAHSAPDVMNALAPLRNVFGEIQVPPPPPDMISAFTVSIYLSDETDHQQVEAAAEEALKRIGLLIYHRELPLAGSWFRRMYARLPGDGTNPLPAAPGTTAPGQAAANQEAALMTNLGNIIESLGSTRDAVVRLGPVLIVKANELLSANQLTPAQQQLLYQRPDLTAAPGEIVKALGLLPRDRMGDMDFPFGDGE
jgi:hypothetical protein